MVLMVRKEAAETFCIDLVFTQWCNRVVVIIEKWIIVVLQCWMLPCGWAGQSSLAPADPYLQKTGCWRSALILLRWKQWRGCHQWFPQECPQTWESHAGHQPSTSLPVKINKWINKQQNHSYIQTRIYSTMSMRLVCHKGRPPVSPPEASSVPGSWWIPPPSVSSLWSALASAASGGTECEGWLEGKYKPASYYGLYFLCIHIETQLTFSSVL